MPLSVDCQVQGAGRREVVSSAIGRAFRYLAKLKVDVKDPMKRCPEALREAVNRPRPKRQKLTESVGRSE